MCFPDENSEIGTSALIPGRNRVYIGAQGPLAGTLQDWWRMIWEHNVSVVIMLTRDIEGGKAKCVKYWPEVDSPNTQDPFIVSCEDVDKQDEIIIRKSKLRNKDTNEDKKVNLIQYIAWPDNGVPESSKAFLDIVKMADEMNPSKGPILVHCSAGIGRTGTFVMLHSILAWLRYQQDQNPGKELRICLPKVLLKFRNERNGLIQTPQQYEFVHVALKEALLSGFDIKVPEPEVESKQEDKGEDHYSSLKGVNDLLAQNKVIKTTNDPKGKGAKEDI